jgi:hypothetical protein
MKTKQPMIKDRDVMHDRITELCQFLNGNRITNYNVASEKLQIAKWHFVTMQQAGIIWKENDCWKGAERLTQQRLDKFVQLSKAYHKRFTRNQRGQCEIKFPKSTQQVTHQVTPQVKRTSKQIRKVSLIKRIKFLFTGQL